MPEQKRRRPEFWATPARALSTIQNAVELARFGRLEHAARTPYSVMASEPIFRLRRYGTPDRARKRRPTIILVPPLMLTAEVYDISPEGSAVAALLGRKIDPWVVDFGAPERQKGGLRRTLSDHIVGVSRAVDLAREEVGEDVHLAGYSQGGMFCYQAAAFRRSDGLKSLITFGSPVDVRRDLIAGLPDNITTRLVDTVGHLVTTSFAGSAVPAWLSRTAFKLITPLKEVRNQIDFLTGLHDRDALVRREGQRRFLAREGWVAWPGPALREFVEQFLMHNRLLSGGFVVDGRALTLADVSCPVLTFVGRTDEIARPPGVRAIRAAAPRAEVYETTLDAGHFGLVVGSKAMQQTWPTVAAWLHWRDGRGKRPSQVLAAEAVTEEARGAESTSVGAAFAALGHDALEFAGEVLGDGVGTARAVLRTIAHQLPRLARLEGVRRNTRISLGLSLAEQAAAAPDGTFFLFAGRAYSYADVNRRIDAVVRGLVSIGVRPGEYVGIYMSTRPSALALATAVSRLGAVAVFLRPDGDLRQELKAGDVHHVIADPERAALARNLFERRIHVLGGAGSQRVLPPSVTDMEAIDPDKVVLPEWFEANPGRSEDTAFVLFSGRGSDMRVNRITNRRWALSAIGTASSVALTATDTAYCWTPIHHPTGLLVSISSAVVGGARLAIGNGFSASTFWDDVRRYGASVVFYTGTLCRELVDAAPDATERAHPVRLFAGSGMPRPLWQRLVKRFGPVGVVEFYASTEGNAILANLSGEKIGSVGRPLPGSAEVAVAAYDPVRRELVQDPSGFCRRAAPGETGLLLARVDPERGVGVVRTQRSIFARGDAWYATNDLFRVDGDGDFWLVDHVGDLIQHRSGPLPSIAIEEAVGELEFISAAAAYGVQFEGVSYEVPAVAIVLRRGAELDCAALRRQVDQALEPDSRPLLVRVVDELPMTVGYRVLKHPLRSAGADPEVLSGRLFWYDRATPDYRPFDAAALAQLRRRLRAGRSTTPGSDRRLGRAERRR